MRAFAAGFLAGWAVLNDYPVFLVAAAIGIYALFKLRDWKHLAAFSVGAAVTVAIMLAYNWGAFGNPFFFSYQAFKLAPTENRQFPEQAVGFVGLTYPKMRILWNVLLDPQRGLFFCNPVLLLSIVGVGYFAQLKQVARRIRRHRLFVRGADPVQRIVWRIDRIVGRRHRDRAAPNRRVGSVHGARAHVSSGRV